MPLLILHCGAQHVSPAATSLLAPQIELGMAPPVLNTAFTVYVAVESQSDSATLPLPTGSVEINFGDGTTTTATLSNNLASAIHTYAAAGGFLITATYAGDSNFQPAVVTQSGLVTTAQTLRSYIAFGDSITGGTGTTAVLDEYPEIIATTENWAYTKEANGGDRLIDQCYRMVGLSQLPGYINTLLVGQNDYEYDLSQGVGSQEFAAAYLACSASTLLLNAGENGTATKLNAQNAAVTKTGTWANSNLYSVIGVNLQSAGSSVSANLNGATLYVQLTTSPTTLSSYTVNISVDGGAPLAVTPVWQYAGQNYSFAPWGVRIPTGVSGTHTVTVTCTVPGAAGCYVDWLGGNGPPAQTPRPSLWVGTPYIDNQDPDIPVYEAMRQTILTTQQELASDGLSAYLADIFTWFDGQTNTACMYDQIHPNDCGDAILAATFLSAMDNLIPVSGQVKLSTSGLHDFVAVADGQTERYGVQVQNTAPVAFPFALALTGSTEFSQTNNCGASLGAGTSCEIVFAFSPQNGETGWSQAQWSLAQQAGFQIVQQDGGTLEGEAYPSAVLTLNTDEHDFGSVSVGSQSGSFGLVVVNPNAVAFTGSVAFTGAISQFTVSGNCSLPLPAFSNCVENVAFQPTAAGWATMNLVITPAAGEQITPSPAVEFLGLGADASAAAK